MYGGGALFLLRGQSASSLELYTPTLEAAMDEGAPASKPPGELYPPIEPYNSGFLTVSDTHEIFYEEYGNRDGNPIVYL